MRIESIIILVLVFSLITISIGGIIGDMKDKYDINVSTEFENQYNFADQINSTASNIKTSLDEVGSEKGYLPVLSGASAVLQATPQVVIMIFSIPKYTSSIIRGVSAQIGVPPAISYILVVMIMISLIFIAFRSVRGENV